MEAGGDPWLLRATMLLELLGELEASRILLRAQPPGWRCPQAVPAAAAVSCCWQQNGAEPLRLQSWGRVGGSAGCRGCCQVGAGTHQWVHGGGRVHSAIQAPPSPHLGMTVPCPPLP